MRDDEVIRHFKDIINNGHRVIHNRETKLNQIEKIETELENDFWKSADINSEMEGLYSELDSSNRNLILTEKKAAEKLMSKEKKERSSLRKNIESQLPSSATGIMNSPPVDDLLTRVDRRLNGQKRDQLKGDILDALENIRSNVRSPNFDVSQSVTILNGNSKSKVRKYAAEFVWRLRESGWRQEDIEEVPDDLRNTNASLSSCLVHYAVREEDEYTGIVFIPGLRIGVSPRTILASKTTLYPEGELSANVVPHLSPMRTEFKRELTYYLHHCNAVGFEVTAFTKDHADEKVIDRATDFISELSNFEPKRALSLPQFHSTFRRFVKKKNTRSMKLRTKFSHNTYTLHEETAEPHCLVKV
jgi:hypothetical protein